MRDTKARRDLQRWMKEKKRTSASVARALHVTGPCISNILRRCARPSDRNRGLLEALTGGEVQAVDWMYPSEKRDLARATREVEDAA